MKNTAKEKKMTTCEQCGGASDRRYLSPRGKICEHCVNRPERGPDNLLKEYPRLERYFDNEGDD